MRHSNSSLITTGIEPNLITLDNAQQESFWTTLKVEFYDRYLWPTKAAAKVGVGDWIERVYNRRRRHLALATITPADFEDRLTQTAQAA
jgi:putative transposase